MRKGEMFTIKVRDGAVTLGLATLAVLLTAADTAGGFILSFPEKGTSLNRALENISKYRSRSVKEYFEELKEISGVNLRNTISRLKQKGLLVKSKDGYRVTKTGYEIALSVKTGADMKSKWDGKWRMITFDIPEKQRDSRDWLRLQLKLHEYKPLHKSVFVGKHPLPEHFYREIYKRGLDVYIHILTVGEIDIDL